jgi:hypothetical protein
MMTCGPLLSGRIRGSLGHFYRRNVALALFQFEVGVFLASVIGRPSALGAEPFLRGGIPNDVFVSHRP